MDVTNRRRGRARGSMGSLRVRGIGATRRLMAWYEWNRPLHSGCAVRNESAVSDLANVRELPEELVGTHDKKENLRTPGYRHKREGKSLLRNELDCSDYFEDVPYDEAD